MPVIAVANPKGGAGKTTIALILATQLAKHGAKVTIIDADPEHWLSQWAVLPGKPDNISVYNKSTEDTIIDDITNAAASCDFVMVDLEGTASMLVASAISMADLVVVPIQGGSMDARGGAKTVRLIATQSKVSRREIKYGIVLTRTSAAVRSRSQRNIEKQLECSDVHVFNTRIVERAAYRDLFDFGGTLEALDPKLVSNVPKAIKNAEMFAGEVVMWLRAIGRREGPPNLQATSSSKREAVEVEL